MATLAFDKANPLLQETEVIDGVTRVKYCPEVALRVCEMIAEGMTYDKVFGEDNRGITCRQTTFFYWVLQHGECKRAYIAAQQISAFVMEDMALQTAQTIANSPGTPQRVSAFKAYIEQLRWSAAKRNPTMFSDKAPVNVTVPIQINTGLDMGDGRGERAPVTLGGQNVYAIEAQVQSAPSNESASKMLTAQDIIDAQKDLAESKKLVVAKKLADNPEHASKVGKLGAKAHWGHKMKLTPKGAKKQKAPK